jgi:hypothetical protein
MINKMVKKILRSPDNLVVVENTISRSSGVWKNPTARKRELPTSRQLPIKETGKRELPILRH